MKCDNCKYRIKTGWEDDANCRIFGWYIPDEYMRKDGEGCICNGRQLAKFDRENRKAWESEGKK